MSAIPEIPHKCTAASATTIAQQIPGAPWDYQTSIEPGGRLNFPTLIRHYDVTTPMGAKNIPAKFSPDGQALVLECPYTHEVFVFRRRPPTPSTRMMGAAPHGPGFGPPQGPHGPGFGPPQGGGSPTHGGGGGGGGGSPTHGPGSSVPRREPFPFPIVPMSDLEETATAAVYAMESDSMYCTHVGIPDTNVNIAVHQFKVTWNASGGHKLAFNGQYDTACAAAIISVLGYAPRACSATAPPLQ